MMILHLALLAAASPATAAVVLDVSPGTDILHSVLDARRAQTSAELAEPLTLRLASGIHRLTRPLEITPDHGLLHFEGQGECHNLVTKHDKPCRDCIQRGETRGVEGKRYASR